MGYTVAPDGSWKSILRDGRVAICFDDERPQRNAVPPEMVARVRVTHLAAKVDVAG